jgi:hypothetical protein
MERGGRITTDSPVILLFHPALDLLRGLRLRSRRLWRVKAADVR